MNSLKTKFVTPFSKNKNLNNKNNKSISNQTIENIDTYSNDGIGNLKNQNQLILNILDNLQQQVYEPLKEILLLINLITANEEQQDNLILMLDMKNFIKVGLNNCNNILKRGFNVIKPMINSHNKKFNLLKSAWNSKLFIDIVDLVQKIFAKKQINPSGEFAFLCISEIYNYSINSPDNLDPRFAECIIEKFSGENGAC